MFKKKSIFFACFMILSTLFFIGAKEYKVAILQIPLSETFVSFFKEMGNATNNTFVTEVVPPSRAIYLIENDQIDILFPSTVSSDPKKAALLKYDYSNARTFKMVFIAYMNKNKVFDVAELKKGNPNNLNVETTASLLSVFEFKANQTTSIEGSLKKVDDGTISGLIYAQDSSDPILKSLGSKNTVRKLYSLNDIAFAIKKGTAGGEIDKILKSGIDKLKANGKFDQILAGSLKNSVYNDWQQ